ncbi:MAG: hypothetical protein V4628_00250 [Pseudomonadota bacterium]
MKKFMAVFVGSITSANHDKWNALDEATRKQREQAGMQAWGKWMQDHGNILVEPGGPLGKTKRVSENGVADIRNDLSGFTIIQAESHAAAAKLFENHPHFAIFPGDAVEIMEIMPIPGM